MCKVIVLLAATAFMASTGFAQGTMGITFDPSDLVDVLETPAAPFFAYIYIGNATPTIGGYECSILISSGSVSLLAADGDNGWTNFGSVDNHLVGYMSPLPNTGDITVVCTLTLLDSSHEPDVTLVLDAAVPSSFSPETPGYADGSAELYACDELTIAVLNGDPPLQSASLSEIKALFD